MLEFSLRFSRFKLIIIGLIIAIRIILDYVYFRIVVSVWGYSGFIDNRSTENFFLSWLFLAISFPLIVPVIKSKRERVSSLIVTILYIFSYIPFTTCIFAGLFSDENFIILNTFYWLILLGLEAFFLTKEVLPSSINVTFGKVGLSRLVVAFLGFLSLSIILFVSWRYTGFRLNFDLYNVYELRGEAREYNFPILINYFLSWTNAINPLLMGYCLAKGKNVLAGFFFMVQMLSFGIGGHKSVFFAPILVLLAAFFGEKVSFQKLKKYILVSYFSLGGVAIFEELIFESENLTGVIIRRLCFLPNHIAYSYFDYFQTHSYDFFRGSFLRHFGFNSPYSDGIARVIGNSYYSLGNNANNGLFSDAFANLGYVGIFIMPILLTAVLFLLDKCSSGININVISAVAIIFSISFLSSFSLTVILTHGLLVCCIILLFLDRNQSSHSEKKTSAEFS